ncbi:hypothetical protein HNP40_000764 [Mycobacteroides chelonae]|nr:hypothetical protein [Mycobacteroides chelonae]
MNYAVPLIVAIVTGLCAPAVAAFAQSWLGDRATIKQRRRDLIDSWRSGLAKLGFEPETVMNTEWYETLRPYLSGEVRGRFEMGYSPYSNVIEVVVPELPGEGEEIKKINLRGDRNVLADRVDELAKGWKID